MIKPGTYKLSRDVQNPAPDRRFKRDWRFVPTWRAGAEFIVTEWSRETDSVFEALDERGELTPERRAAIIESARYATIRAVDSPYSHYEIGPGNEASFEALSAALVPVEESIDAMFARLSVRSNFARWLVDSGRLTPQLFEKLWAAYQGDDTPSVPLVEGSAP